MWHEDPDLRPAVAAAGNTATAAPPLGPPPAPYLSLHGPSVLGLDDPPDTDYLFEEERSGTARRVFLWLILLVVAGLFYLQWRGNGQFGLRAALNAIMDQSTAPAEVKPSPAVPAAETAAAKPQADHASEPAAAPVASEDAANKADASKETEKAASQEKEDAAASATAREKTELPPAKKPEAAPPAAAAVATEEPEDTHPRKHTAAHAVDAKPAEAPGTKLYARGESFLYGRGVTKSCDQAVVYFRAAADAGYSAASSKLGAMYATGNCVPQDRAQAYRWMSKAASAEPANTYLARNRDMLWEQMTAAERARAR